MGKVHLLPQHMISYSCMLKVQYVLFLIANIHKIKQSITVLQRHLLKLSKDVETKTPKVS